MQRRLLLLLLQGTTAKIDPVTVELTAFAVGITTKKGADLTKPPFEAHVKALASKTSYDATHALGSDKAAIEKAIDETRAKAAPLTVPVTLRVADGKLTVDVADAANAASGNAEIWLCPFASKIPVTVERGENRGHALTYYDVVRRWVKLGDWKGKAQTFTVPVSDVVKGESDIDHVAVLVQREPKGKPGLMLGAATVSLL